MSQLVDLRIDGYSLLILLKPEVTFNLISAFPELQVLFITSLTYRVDGFTMDKINLFLLNVVPTLFKLTTLVLDTFEMPIQYGHLPTTHAVTREVAQCEENRGTLATIPPLLPLTSGAVPGSMPYNYPPKPPPSLRTPRVIQAPGLPGINNDAGEVGRTGPGDRFMPIPDRRVHSTNATR
ncbi:hypothetical protein NMY22_g5860 [Coprinellus aureogranulatus]|nr:hypothetical protein NMY22_g5860 [Coprinellus aureogranulatus]